MNLKLRFSLLFTLLVACLLVAFAAAVYGIVHARRHTVFMEQVGAWLPAYDKAVTATKHGDSTVLGFTAAGRIVDFRATVIDAEGNILASYPAQPKYVPDAVTMGHIREKKTYEWDTEDGNEYTGLLIPGTGHVVLAGGYDEPGFERLSDLKPALIVMVITGVLLAALLSLFFSQMIFAPFRKLAKQMQATFLKHATEKLPVSSREDVINDMTRNFNGMLDRINQLTEFRKSFVFHASHEFRTPLATMLSETEAALASNLTAEGYREVLLSLKEEQQDLIELTSSLLLLSLSDTGEFTKGWALIRIDEVLYDTISRAGKFFPSLEVDMNFASIPDNPDDFLVRGEESLLRSAFLNILKNGHMYSVDQKVNVLIEFVGDTILVHFDNRGMQLHAEEKTNIMEPFFRGSNALKTKGYGLGLSVVNRIVLLMKGRLQYTPVANDINRFTITLRKAQN